MQTTGLASETRVLYGIVDPSGGIVSGSGFRVDHVDKGIFTVFFEKPFNILPAFSVTEIFPWPMDRASHGGSTKDNGVVIAIENDRVRLKVGDGSGDATNRAFTFIVVGI